MAGKLAELYVLIKAKTDNLEKGLASVEKSTAGLTNKLSSMAKIAVGAFAAIATVRAATKFMESAVKAAAEQELAEKNLTAALISTGREVDANFKHFKNYASALQEATVYGDEEIISAQALLLQLTKLNREGIDQATKGAMGLASVFGMNLKTAVELVAKGISGNYGALSRYNIRVKENLTDEQKRVDILKQLEVMYQRSQAEVDTFSGRMKQLKNAWGDLKETIGRVVTEHQLVNDIMRVTTDVVKKLTKDTDKQTEAWTKLTMVIGGWTTFAEKAAQAITSQTKDWENYETRLNEINEIWFKYGENTQEALKAIAEGKEGTKALQDYLYGIAGGAFVAACNLKPLSMIVEKVIYDWQKVKIPALEIPEIEGLTKYLAKPPSAFEETLAVLNKVKEGWSDYFEIIETESQESGEIFLNASESIEESLKKIGDTTGLTVEQIVKGMKYWAAETKTSAALWEQAMSTMNVQQQEFAWGFIDAMMTAELSLRGFVNAALQSFEKWALGQIIPKVLAAFPFPFNLLAATGAIATVRALFAPLKFEKGAVFEKPTYIQGIVAERNREFLLPQPMLTHVVKESMRNIITEKIIQEPTGPIGRSRGSRAANLNVALMLNEHQISSTVIKIVEDATRTGHLTIDSRSLR